MSENLAALGNPTHEENRTENEIADREYFQRPPCVERWLRNKAPTTRKKFLGYMGRFQLLTGHSPESFLEWLQTVESVEVQGLIDRTSIEFKPAIQFCYRVALRSFLRHNGSNTLPKTASMHATRMASRLQTDEIRKILGYLSSETSQIFWPHWFPRRSGLHTIRDHYLRHIVEILEAGIVPTAVRFIELRKDCIREGLCWTGN